MNIKLDSLKKINTGIILKALKKSDMTRVELQKYTELAAGTVSNLIKELVADKVILETDIEKNKERGRKGTVLSLNSNYKYIIGMKINRGVIIGSLNSIDGEMLQELSLDIGGKEEIQVTKCIVKIYELLKQNRKILGVGIAFPGQIDSLKGIVRYSSFYKWENIHLIEKLQSFIDVPVFLENDVRAMTLAEKEFFDKEFRNLLYINIDKGISAGIIINGSLLFGDNFIAGQIGHTFIENNNKQCSCGKIGCLETISSNTAILGEYSNRLNLNSCDITIESFIEKIRENDDIAHDIFDHSVYALAIAISNISNTFNISNLVIGGELLKLDLTLKILDNYLQKLCLPYVYENLIIKKSHFNHRNNTIGGVSVVLNKFFEGEII
ncbi:ROK family transcriptional regulator [uncultured Fusobacterium sp.]|uniref:ROK family transcriptional regulator n=1 Tax=uncultured Fusobacterium sp. TaxID=159267 RepID=UPI00259717D1|nr:ROK family transcriptional regulator [uncultured Fusobacterium sp.]